MHTKRKSGKKSQYLIHLSEHNKTKYGSDLETNLNHMYQVSNYPCFRAISLYTKSMLRSSVDYRVQLANIFDNHKLLAGTKCGMVGCKMPDPMLNIPV